MEVIRAIKHNYCIAVIFVTLLLHFILWLLLPLMIDLITKQMRAIEQKFQVDFALQSLIDGELIN